jgi:hypothetical protein
MFELGKHVPIIPVIMKADTMTIREANNYKQEVFNRLQVGLGSSSLRGIAGHSYGFAADNERDRTAPKAITCASAWNPGC